jgi:hypothetical protein
MFSRRNILESLIILSICILLYSCANRGYPKGGPKDEEAPYIVKESPINGGVNFNEKKLNIYFNEFVQLKDVASNFMISPPQKKKPKVKLRGKRVLVEFQDSLRDSTTYSLDFGTSIVDNNEANPMGRYRYFFSTGNHIDTMQIGGNIYDSYTHEPIENAYVMLYDEMSKDSVSLLEMPRYVARTDTAGYFSISNIQQKRYKIMAIEDTDRNYMFTSPTEKVAYTDSIIFPISFPMTKRDTSSKDSTAMISYTAYGPENISMYMFKEKETQQYMINSERKERGCIDFSFAVARKDSLKVDLFGIDNEDEVFLKEINASRDTIKYWIVDTTIFNRDTLRAELKYLRTDTLGMLVEIRDTVDFDFEDEEIIIPKKKKDKDKPKKIDYLKMKFNLRGSININSQLCFEVEQPLKADFKDKLTLYKIENDTVKVKQDINIRQHPNKIRKYYIDYAWIPEAKYSLEADSASIYSVFGKYNKKIENKMTVKSEEVYGKLDITLKNGSYPMIFSLISKSSKKLKLVRTIYPDKDGVYTIKYIAAGEYSFMIISDRNGNKLWDTGNYLKHLQPEEVIYIDKKIEVRENWDFEESVDFLNLKNNR